MLTRTYPDEFLPPILKHVSDLGFVIFTRGEFNLNIIGTRNPESTPNKFDDHIHIVYKEKLEALDKIRWKEIILSCTTDPGTYWLTQGKRLDGCAILAHPQQCRGAYKLDFHRGNYLALCQRLRPVQVWRDSNKDNIADIGGTTGQLFQVNSGINIHRASSSFTSSSQNVNRYSAGCTVIQHRNEFDLFINLCQAQQNNGQGSTFTYTIIEGNFL